MAQEPSARLEIILVNVLVHLVYLEEIPTMEVANPLTVSKTTTALKISTATVYLTNVWMYAE